MAGPINLEVAGAAGSQAGRERPRGRQQSGGEGRRAMRGPWGMGRQGRCPGQDRDGGTGARRRCRGLGRRAGARSEDRGVRGEVGGAEPGRVLGRGEGGTRTAA